ncbi:MAG: hypothetical protein EPO21_10720 [Chloroflexota bacterium]|nr:MAG: hypothetical protein EPO21_10720 [Chloroflexota bacterium]
MQKGSGRIKWRSLVRGRARPWLMTGLVAAVAALVLLAAGCSGSSAPASSPQSSAKSPSPSSAPSSSAQASTKPSSSTTGYANPDLLIETDALAQKLTDPTIRIVDARKADAYKDGHIKGAVSIPQAAAFLPGAAQGILGTPEQIAKLFGDKGISNDNKVIVYDAGQNYEATYLLWALETYGHTKVSVLNGGSKSGRKRAKRRPGPSPLSRPRRSPSSLTQPSERY